MRFLVEMKYQWNPVSAEKTLNVISGIINEQQKEAMKDEITKLIAENQSIREGIYKFNSKSLGAIKDLEFKYYRLATENRGASLYLRAISNDSIFSKENQSLNTNQWIDDLCEEITKRLPNDIIKFSDDYNFQAFNIIFEKFKNYLKKDGNSASLLLFTSYLKMQSVNIYNNSKNQDTDSIAFFNLTADFLLKTLITNNENINEINHLLKGDAKDNKIDKLTQYLFNSII